MISAAIARKNLTGWLRIAPEATMRRRDRASRQYHHRDCPARVFLLEVTQEDRFTSSESFHQERRKLRWMCGAHVSVPFSGRIPDQRATKARWVSRTARNPAGVTVKYRFARPPRSGVSPKRGPDQPALFKAIQALRIALLA